jgi:hypothetical protein
MDKSLWWCHGIRTVRAKATAAVFDAMGRITQMVSQDGMREVKGVGPL